MDGCLAYRHTVVIYDSLSVALCPPNVEQSSLAKCACQYKYENPIGKLMLPKLVFS